jgi:hypothetical protein
MPIHVSLLDRHYLAMSPFRRRRADKLQANAAKSVKPALGRGKRAIFLLATVLLVAAATEGLFAVALRFINGEWPYASTKSASYMLFETHPDWVVTPRKDVTITILGPNYPAHYIHHNTDGFRGQEFSRVKTKYRVACVGGSTTYCIGVSENQTWEFYLEQLLQPDCEVLNFGIPGHSSVEHKKLLPQILSRYEPDLVIVQMGLNDLRNMNLADPGPDYENFHQPTLRFSTWDACWRDRLPPVAVVQGIVTLLKKTNVLSDSPFPPGEPPGRVSDSVDQRVIEIFGVNLDILLHECRARRIRVVLLPHALSPEVITDSNYQWWVPYLTKKGIFNALDALNAVMRRKADGDSVIYAGFMDGTTWGSAEFCDPSHLNAHGNLRLARLLEEGLPWKRFLDEERSTPK